MKTTTASLLLAVAQLGLLAHAAATEDYVAHEWGTFTSVQGADGVLIEWNPLETTVLPGFVHDWSKPGVSRQASGVLNPPSKSRFITLQRMETPVIYFYSDKERTVDVTVRFPRGLITEWYPLAHDIGPSVFPANKLARALDGLVQQSGLTPRLSFSSMFSQKGTLDSRIAWKQVGIVPTTPGAGPEGNLPTDRIGSHYFAARETDAAPLRVTSPGFPGGTTEHEKFLFYRGVGNFTTPLLVSFNSEDETRLFLANTGAEELRHLFILTMNRGRGKFLYQSHVPPGQQVPVEFQPGTDLMTAETLTTQLSDQMSRALVEEGLYEREARAMVKTWRESWFEEDGLRVLYLLPAPWTDSVLPLALDPKPRELVRVMVGRAEIITPQTEWELLKQIVAFAAAGPDNRQAAIESVRRLGLGRFIEPALHRVLGSHPNSEFSQTARDLMKAVVGSPKSGGAIARQ